MDVKVSLENGIFERFTDTQNRSLETEAKEWGKQVGQLILGGIQLYLGGISGWACAVKMPLPLQKADANLFR
jgi:hypothetical protein